MIRDIKIKKVNRGYIVEIGCQKFVVENDNYNKIVEGLKDYFDDPRKAERKYVESDFRSCDDEEIQEKEAD